MDRKYALIPAYEPDGRLLEIIEDAVDEGFQVIVVDDGSGDDCQQYFKQAEYMATVLHHSENKGKGAALKTGCAQGVRGGMYPLRFSHTRQPCTG